MKKKPYKTMNRLAEEYLTVRDQIQSLKLQAGQVLDELESKLSKSKSGRYADPDVKCTAYRVSATTVREHHRNGFKAVRVSQR